MDVWEAPFNDKKVILMSQVQYKVPVFMTINGNKICYLIEYYRYVELRSLGLKDSQIIAGETVNKRAA